MEQLQKSGFLNTRQRHELALGKVKRAIQNVKQEVHELARAEADFASKLYAFRFDVWFGLVESIRWQILQTEGAFAVWM